MRENGGNLNKELIKEILNMKFSFGIINYGITPMHVIWLVFMVMMITHLFPNDKLSMALRKNKKETYVEVPGYSQPEPVLYCFDSVNSLRDYVCQVSPTFLVGFQSDPTVHALQG